MYGPGSDQRNQTPRQTRRAFSVQSATQSTITDRRRVAADNALRTPASIQHPLGPSTRNASLDKGEHCSLTLHPLPLPMGEVAAVRLTERALSVSFADSSPKGGAETCLSLWERWQPSGCRRGPSQSASLTAPPKGEPSVLRQIKINLSYQRTTPSLYPMV